MRAVCGEASCYFPVGCGEVVFEVVGEDGHGEAHPPISGTLEAGEVVRRIGVAHCNKIFGDSAFRQFVGEFIKELFRCGMSMSVVLHEKSFLAERLRGLCFGVGVCFGGGNVGGGGGGFRGTFLADYTLEQFAVNAVALPGFFGDDVVGFLCGVVVVEADADCSAPTSGGGHKTGFLRAQAMTGRTRTVYGSIKLGHDLPFPKSKNAASVEL